MANLLPPEDQKIIMSAQVARFVFVFAIVALVLACVFCLALVPSYLALVLGNVKVQSNLGGSASTTNDAAVMRETKAVIAQLDTITEATSSARTLLSTVIDKKPTGITLTELTLSAGNPGKIVIVAKAAQSNLIQIYRDALKTDARFASVNVPVSALLASAGDTFTITIAGNF